MASIYANLLDQRIFFVRQHGRRFIVLEHQYGHRDVMWKRSMLVIVKLCLLPRFLAGKQKSVQEKSMTVEDYEIVDECGIELLITVLAFPFQDDCWCYSRWSEQSLWREARQIVREDHCL